MLADRAAARRRGGPARARPRRDRGLRSLRAVDARVSGRRARARRRRGRTAEQVGHGRLAPDVVVVLDLADAVAEARVAPTATGSSGRAPSSTPGARRVPGAGGRAGLAGRRRRRHARRGGRARLRRAGGPSRRLRHSVVSPPWTPSSSARTSALAALRQAADGPGTRTCSSGRAARASRTRHASSRRC